MIQREHHGVRRHEFEVGLVHRHERLAAALVGPERLQRGDVVIGRVEAVILQVGDRRDQLVEPRRVLPPRLELSAS